MFVRTSVRANECSCERAFGRTSVRGWVLRYLSEMLRYLSEM